MLPVIKSLYLVLIRSNVLARIRNRIETSAKRMIAASIMELQHHNQKNEEKDYEDGKLQKICTIDLPSPADNQSIQA
ncbi:MAG: hypothetical protein OXC54_01530 [Rhodospirillaceae bacterium]|nr:hypothetical protein [Rhodospirillaceae bacterium]MCY4238393.1 hypothetical protein [Rhodospirillaceae bacterium]MCY4309988.1 hypothetical protein [Rhodospirillaceae bacterium]